MLGVLPNGEPFTGASGDLPAENADVVTNQLGSLSLVLEGPEPCSGRLLALLHCCAYGRSGTGVPVAQTLRGFTPEGVGS